MAVLYEFALAVFLGLAAGHFGFGCSDIGFGDLEVLAVLLRVEPGEEIALFDLCPDIDRPFEDLAVDAKAEIGLIARLDSPVSDTLSPPSCTSTVTVRTGRMTVAAAFSSLWQAAKNDIRTRAQIAADAKGNDRSKQFTGPILLIIGTPLGLDCRRCTTAQICRCGRSYRH